MTATVACAESAPTAATTPTRKRWTVAEVEALFALPFNDMLFQIGRASCRERVSSPV